MTSRWFTGVLHQINAEIAVNGVILYNSGKNEALSWKCVCFGGSFNSDDGVFNGL